MTLLKNSRKQILHLTFLFAVLSLSPTISASGQEQEESISDDPESLVRALYEEVSFEKGTQPDWSKVKTMFIDEAVITLRTSQTKMTVFSVDGFVEDFVRFIKRSKADQIGFQEKILTLNKTVFGDMASFQVLFSVKLKDRRSPPQRGIDNFLLIKRDSVWKIVAITNEFVSPKNPVPADLKP